MKKEAPLFINPGVENCEKYHCPKKAKPEICGRRCLISFVCLFYRTVEGAVVRPVPRVKRLLSDGAFLPHIVQLLLTFDPSLVEKVAKLLCEVSMEQEYAGKTNFLSV